MATVDECEAALHELAARLAANAEARGKADLDRTLSCDLHDIGVIFGGRLYEGTLIEIRQVNTITAQVKLRMSSDDLLEVTAGQLHLAQAWATGRIHIEAGFFDLIKLRSIF